MCVKDYTMIARGGMKEMVTVIDAFLIVQGSQV